MKKVLVLFGIMAMLPYSAMAFLYEDQTSSMENLGRQGYSESTLQAVDWTRYRNGGISSKYVRYYQPKRGNALGRAYQSAKVYLDPFQDDGRFGDHHIQFSNTWTGEETVYSSDLKGKRVENL